jgi:hypothetical protein
VGLDLALKAEKKLVKNGRFVGIVSDVRERAVVNARGWLLGVVIACRSRRVAPNWRPGNRYSFQVDVAVAL